MPRRRADTDVVKVTVKPVIAVSFTPRAFAMVVLRADSASAVGGAVAVTKKVTASVVVPSAVGMALGWCVGRCDGFAVGREDGDKVVTQTLAPAAENDLGAHSAHTVAASADCALPDEQRLHALAAMAEYEPGPQLAQLVPPAAGWKVPGAQFVQVVETSAPATLE